VRIRSDSHYIEHGMQRVPSGWTGRWWRLGGFLVVAMTWAIVATRWLAVLAIWAGIMAGAIFVATWYTAAWFDAQEKK